jgi:flagellar biosynthesis/type III secretory pathway protein FliH
MALKHLLAPLAVSALFVAPAPALAQSPDWQLGPNVPAARSRYADAEQVSYSDLRRRAYDQGYREGLKEGEKDGRRGDRFAYQDEREFQRADRGYHRNYGDRERYRQLFRDGYASGYSEGYSRVSRYGRNPGVQGPYGRQGPYAQQGGYGNWGGRYPGGGAYYTPAFDNGARDGYEKGTEDARKNRSFDPLRHSWYRSGDRHYEGRYGSRDQYKNVYRQGFERGYERGYREGRYR